MGVLSHAQLLAFLIVLPGNHERMPVGHGQSVPQHDAELALQPHPVGGRLAEWTCRRCQLPPPSPVTLARYDTGSSATQL
jgi:hypothetical protein